jgi:hypothetical protein
MSQIKMEGAGGERLNLERENNFRHRTPRRGLSGGDGSFPRCLSMCVTAITKYVVGGLPIVIPSFMLLMQLQCRKLQSGIRINMANNGRQTTRSLTCPAPTACPITKTHDVITTYYVVRTTYVVYEVRSMEYFST